jgi:isoleucyl-tRNA synthetase
MDQQNLEKQAQEEVKPKQIQIEEEILEFWKTEAIFEKTLAKTSDSKPYVFYDGPPFATGLPHYGHILGSAVKDLFGRYWTMKGFQVRRRWGWDCHGLPIEQLMEQKLGISGKKQIEELGIDKFNDECRSNVLKFVDEWGKMVDRIGRFVDFDDSYKTMDPTFMESVWWALKQMWEKDFVYEGKKVLLYCPRCETPLSNFEVAADNSYKDVSEDAVYVKALVDETNGVKTYALFWTTTPWTLPGNAAIAVGSNIDYVVVRPSAADLEAGIEQAQYMVAKSKAEVLFNNPQILKEFRGQDVAGFTYKPPFEVPAIHSSENAHKIYAADFVTEEDGTGIVHTAVLYGEDDYNLGLKVGLPTVQVLSPSGVFNDQAPEYIQGIFYRDAESTILARMEQEGTLFKKEVYSHSVPFCWRCGTRLFYNAIPAWFINIQKVKPRLRELNDKDINWYPGHLKEGRFDKGLENAPDWNISRNRYWATALPFWRCDSKSCGRVTCIGSLQELSERSINYRDIYDSTDITKVDLHRPYIDKVVLECDVCKSEMHRVPEVVDCWVESASMPFAEYHYPFENQEIVKERMPAQFVAEYINQTRAWFYVMHALNTILFDQAPFQNVVTTGVVLAEDGQKMSKSKGNFPDPWIIINKYGVDALRFYLLTSPVMQGENLSFTERELDEVYKKVLMLLNNVHSFLRMYSNEKIADAPVATPKNVLDQWILALLHQLQVDVTTNLDKYDIPRAYRPVVKFVNDLSTWYVRRSRDRFKDENSGPEGLRVLSYVLTELSKLNASIMPFVSDYIYKDITGNESVHLADWNQDGYQPLTEAETKLLSEMQSVRDIVELGLAARKESNFKVRQPLDYLAYSSKSGAPITLGPDLEQIMAEELNVKSVHCTGEIAELPESVLKEGNGFAALLSIKMTPELKEEGYARELERYVQDLRKKIGLKVGDLIDIYYNTSDSSLEMALVERFDRKKTFAGQIKRELEVEPDHEAQLVIDERAIWIGIVKI